MCVCVWAGYKVLKGEGGVEEGKEAECMGEEGITRITREYWMCIAGKNQTIPSSRIRG